MYLLWPIAVVLSSRRHRLSQYITFFQAAETYDSITLTAHRFVKQDSEANIKAAQIRYCQARTDSRFADLSKRF